MDRDRTWIGVAVALLFLLSALPAQAAPPERANPAPREFHVEPVSTRADTVTGGDVLVEVHVPRNVPPHQVRISVDDRDVTEAFAPAPGEPRILLGLVDGLAVGTNRLRVSANGQGHGRPSATLEVTNHPSTGPVLSGPHQEPFICQTEAFGLGPAVDGDCDAETTVAYRYRSTATNTFVALDPSAPLPDDVATTTTTDGDVVDYIVRLETGVLNRAVYQIAILHQPGMPLPDPWTHTPGWNGRLVYTFGGGCSAGYRQGASTGGVLNDAFLAPGFAVASSSFNVFGNNCNDVTSAETMMMVKEHFIESFGRIDHTIGWGCSGGSMQQHLIAQNYPGLLDGIVPTCSYPDIATIITPVVDCALLSRAMDESDRSWSLEQRSAITGYANNGVIETCSLWNLFFSPSWITPEACPGVIPQALRYDAITNPGGARCTIHDNTINVYGADPVTGFARRPVDNEGVQYGLQAFNDGIIDFDQFAQLNELAGGYDVDGNLVAERTIADPEALRIAYQTGRVNSGAGGLADIPIMDVRGYTDRNVDIHDRFRSFSTRERLLAQNGHHDNHVIWTAGPATSIVGQPYATQAVYLIDEWLAAVADDNAPGTPAEKVVRNRPAEAVDACWTPEGEQIVELATYDGEGVCNELYPNHADPRLVAGAPVANDVLKCELKPVTADDYTVELSAQQLDRLRDIFTEGVCDYTRPGVQQQQLAGTWIRY